MLLRLLFNCMWILALSHFPNMYINGVGRNTAPAAPSSPAHSNKFQPGLLILPG